MRGRGNGYSVQGVDTVFTRCPGADSILQPLPEPVICPHCRGEVEMFTNEISFRCYHCGELIVRDKKPSCFDWCEYADECAKQIGFDLDTGAAGR